MKIKSILLILTVFYTGTMNAQQSPVYSQYMVNKFLINPATAGSTGYSFVNMVAREQYTGFYNAPRTFSLTGQTRILDDSYIRRQLRVKKSPNMASRDTRVGLGGHLYSDRNGAVTKTGLQFTYAYHINFNNKLQLSMGLTGSGYQFKLDDTDAFIYNPEDPLLNSERKSFFVPDASFGVYITDNKFYSGVSMTDLLGSSLKLGKDVFKDNYRTMRHFSVIAGYKFNMENGFAIEPSALIRSTRMFTQADFTLRTVYNNNYWLGFSYRTNNELVTMLGLNVDMFFFGYSYDASFGQVRNYSSGSHEIMMGVRFGDSSVRRFRWIRKDSMEFDM